MSLIEQLGGEEIAPAPMLLPSVVRTRSRGRGAMRRRLRQRIGELEAVKEAIERCRDELLDFNPTLSLMADALHRGIEMEIAVHFSSETCLRPPAQV